MVYVLYCMLCIPQDESRYYDTLIINSENMVYVLYYMVCIPQNESRYNI